MDVRKMLQRYLDNTDRRSNAISTRVFGAVGLLVLPDLLVQSHSRAG